MEIEWIDEGFKASESLQLLFCSASSPWLHFSHSFLKLWTGSPRKWRNRYISQLLQGHLIRADNISMHSNLAKGKSKTNLWNAGCCFQQDFQGSNLSNLSGSKNWLVLSYLKESAQNCTPTQDEERRRATTISCSKWILDEGWSLNHLMSKYIQIQRFLNIQPWYF